MSKKTQKKVPELRFPEFEGDWEIKKIEDIASVTSGGTPSRADSTYWNGHIPWVTTSESSQSEIFDSNEKITRQGLENSSAKLFPKNTIPMAMYGQGKTRGQVSLLRIEAATSQNFAAIILKDGYIPEFVYHFLKQEYDRLRSGSNGNAHQNLSSGFVKQYKVPTTKSAEQEKIARFLGAVDARLNQLRRKYELLQTYKRGVMQKLFSQQIRFKQDDGTPFPDWQKKKLDEIFTESRIKGSSGDKAKKITVKLWGKGVFYKEGSGSENTQYFVRKSGQFIYSKLDFLNCAFGIIPDDLDGLESTVDMI